MKSINELYNQRGGSNEIKKEKYYINGIETLESLLSLIKGNDTNKSSLRYNDIDELISDKGIIYKTNNSENNLSRFNETYIEELFEQFKQFILFQKMRQDN